MAERYKLLDEAGTVVADVYLTHGSGGAGGDHA